MIFPPDGICLTVPSIFKAVNQTSGQFFAAAEFFDQVQAESARFAFAVDVSHRTHQRTQNHFGVIFEEVDLHSTVGKMHNL